MTGPVVLALRVLLALALYAFLGLALWMLAQDLRQTGREIAQRAVPSLRLRLRTRNQRSVYQEFSQAEVMLGRDPWCDVLIADKSVSARHARLSFHDGQWWVEDLASTNGTRLNHERLSRPTVVTAGDEITCGRAHVIVSLASRARNRDGRVQHG